MRKIMLIAAAIGGLTALGGTAAMASPMHERHDMARYEAPRRSHTMHTGYDRWHGHEWQRHHHWQHRHWRTFN
jgi:hypothetical protein